MPKQYRILGRNRFIPHAYYTSLLMKHSTVDATKSALVTASWNNLQLKTKTHWAKLITALQACSVASQSFETKSIPTAQQKI